jgi:High potential iron-sulfur protein
MKSHSLISHDVSRRSVLQGVACAAAAAPVLATVLSTEPAMAAGKLTQAAAKYQDTPKNGQRCDECTLWEPPNGCKSVKGTIAPEGWCKLYVRKPS